jgi:hypothetical protein
VISSDDLTQMRADKDEIRSDNTVSVVIRRGDTSLPAQTVRIALAGGWGRRLDSKGGEEARGRVLISGAIDLDIQVDDRFTVSGVLYRVTFVRPDRRIDTVAEAEAVE